MARRAEDQDGKGSTVRTSARLATITSLVLLGVASALVVPQVAGSQVGDEPPVENASTPADGELLATPAEGPTGTRISVSGAGCQLPDTTLPGDAVVVTLAPPEGAAVFTAQVPVADDGSWQGEVAAPAGTPPGELLVSARCTAPEQDLVTYASAPHTVTGEGSATQTAALPPASTLAAPDPSLATGPPPAAGAVGGDAGLPAFANPSAPIEALPAYDGQTTCSPSVKPGMAAFQQLVHGAFPSTGWGSISRSCTSGGQSEHKEGRAWDWPVNAFNGTEASYANQVISWLLATDSRGNRYANARRLGIMYIIWNRQMFRLYRPDDGWLPYSGSSPHTDHVHFSLTRAGGAGTTSWWTASTESPRIEFSSASTAVSGTFDAPVTGDFDGDGRDDVLWYQSGPGADHVWWGRSDRAFTGTGVAVNGTYRVATGDLDGDGRDDVLFHAPGTATDYVWYGAGNRTFQSVAYRVDGTYQPLTGDFDGDGRDDVFWYGAGSALDVIWKGSASRVMQGYGANVTGVYQPLTGDFDGDGRGDIFWYGPGAGNDVGWFGGPAGFAGKGITVSGTYPGAVAGDLNGDGRHDIVWYAPGPGKDNLWVGLHNRTFRHQPANVNGRYDPALVGDFDGNEHDDVLWYAPGGTVDYLWWTS
jgi:hypothetical protein